MGRMRASVDQFNRRGLFIGGCPKSGTTLLLSLLDGHPQLVVLPEETFFLENRARYAQMKDNLEKLKFLLEKTDLRLLNRGRFAPERECDSTDVRDYTGFDYQRFVTLAREFIQSPQVDDSLLFSELVRAYAIVAGNDWQYCARWVEKSTSNEVRHAAMDELYPEARLVQLVRDPRAVYASRKKRLVNRCGCHAKAHRLLREWNRSAREIPRLRLDPSRFLVIRYEDLVKHPREIVEAVCRLGNFDFADTLFEPTRAGVGWQGNSSFQTNFNTINAAPADQWKDYLTPHEIWWIELHCRHGMELADYPRQTTGRFSLFSWLKRLPGESWTGYFRARRASLCQFMGWLKECRYDH
jgi:Sulfotransferase family